MSDKNNVLTLRDLVEVALKAHKEVEQAIVNVSFDTENTTLWMQLGFLHAQERRAIAALSNFKEG